MFGRRALAMWVVLLASGCGDAPDRSEQGSSAEPPRATAPEGLRLPSGFRTVAFSDCCIVPVPKDASATLPGNLIDNEIMIIERDGLRVKLEYWRQGQPALSAAEPAASVIRVDGSEAVLLDTASGKEGERRVRFSASVPRAASVGTMGSALDAEAVCTGVDNCTVVRALFGAIRWQR
jgi:hypothetical protein